MENSVKKFETGAFAVNTWVVPLDKKCAVVIDPGGADSNLMHHLQECGFRHLEIMLTHGHFDHLGGIPALITAYPDYRLWIHQADAAYLGTAAKAVHLHSFAPLRAQSFIESLTEPLPEPTDFLTEGAVVNDLTVLHTPGHTQGSVCLWSRAYGILFSGDTLFYGSRGRTDLAGGDETQIYASLQRLFNELPENTQVYTGHGSQTSIGFEKKFQGR